MQAIELPTREQTRRIKELIKSLGGYVRGYKLDDLSKEEADTLLRRLELPAIYDRLPPDKQKKAYKFMEFMEWLEKGNTPPR